MTQPSFLDNVTERMRIVEGIKRIMNIEDANLNGLIIEETSESQLLLAKKKLYIPEKKIVLLDCVSELESQLLWGVTKGKGDLTVSKGETWH